MEIMEPTQEDRYNGKPASDRHVYLLRKNAAHFFFKLQNKRNIFLDCSRDAEAVDLSAASATEM